MDKMLKRLKWTEIIEGALTALAGLACVIFPDALANMFSFLIGGNINHRNFSNRSVFFGKEIFSLSYPKASGGRCICSVRRRVFASPQLANHYFRRDHRNCGSGAGSCENERGD